MMPVKYFMYCQLKQKLRMVPEKLAKAEKEIEEYQEKYDQIMQLKPLKEQVTFPYTQQWRVLLDYIVSGWPLIYCFL